jgi:hypothetical protein
MTLRILMGGTVSDRWVLVGSVRAGGRTTTPRADACSEWKFSLASEDWFLFSRPLLPLVKREENVSISLADRWKSEFLD